MAFYTELRLDIGENTIFRIPHSTRRRNKGYVFKGDPPLEIVSSTSYSPIRKNPDTPRSIHSYGRSLEDDLFRPDIPIDIPYIIIGRRRALGILQQYLIIEGN